MTARLAMSAGIGVMLLGATTAFGQAPPPQAPMPAPQPPPPAAPGPPAQSYPPYGAPPYGAPQSPPYGAPAGPYPNAYPPPTPYPPAPQPQPAVSNSRSPGEMVYLYGVGAAYGLGTGIWIDALANANDPGIAFIAPAALGIGVPVATYFWDAYNEFDRGVPSSIATGALLGGIEGMAVSGLQWQLTGGPNPAPNSGQWTFPVWSTLTFVGATGGGVGGFAFGEWFHPDPRGLAFIASGAGWGSLFGAMFGAGLASDVKFSGDGAAIGGFISYNAGILAAGLVSTVYTPAWESLEYMWLGDLLGTVATTPIYLFYIGGGQAQHGLIANALGGLAGLGIAAALTANLTDTPTAASWSPPFTVTVAPNATGGAQVMAAGLW